MTRILSSLVGALMFVACTDQAPGDISGHYVLESVGGHALPYTWADFNTTEVSAWITLESGLTYCDGATNEQAGVQHTATGCGLWRFDATRRDVIYLRPNGSNYDTRLTVGRNTLIDGDDPDVPPENRIIRVYKRQQN